MRKDRRARSYRLDVDAGSSVCRPIIELLTRDMYGKAVMIRIDASCKERLHQLGVACFHAPPFSLPDICFFEPPCSLKWAVPDYWLKLGAFSYAVSGYYFAVDIGRYVSIGEAVQIGRHSHPTKWSSTSPVFYQDPTAVIDRILPEASHVNFNAPQRAPEITTIGNDVYIGHGALIMPGVVVGDGAVVGAMSVVTKDVPPYSIVAGNPAVVKSYRFSDNIIERFLAVSWWRYAFWDLSGLQLTSPERFIGGVEDLLAKGLLPYAPSIVDVRRDVTAPGRSI